MPGTPPKRRIHERAGFDEGRWSYAGSNRRPPGCDPAAAGCQGSRGSTNRLWWRLIRFRR
jgi:hypothetical protein